MYLNNVSNFPDVFFSVLSTWFLLEKNIYLNDRTEIKTNLLLLDGEIKKKKKTPLHL